MGDEQSSVEKLIEILLSQDFDARFQASRDLVKAGELAVEPLIAILNDPSKQYVWWTTVTILGEIGDNRAVEPIITVLKQSDSADLTRKYSAWALGDLRDPRAVESLIETLHARDHYEEEEEDGKLYVSDEPDHETIEAAAWALYKIGDVRAVEPIVNRLLEGDHWHDEALKKWGEPAFALLLKALESTDETVRKIAASSLGEFGDHRAVEPLIRLARDDSSQAVRHGAVYALNALKDPRAFITLIDALDDPYEQVRLYAAMGAAYFSRPNKDKFLTYTAEAEQPSVKQLVTESLATLGEEKIADNLTRALQDTFAFIKVGAAECLYSYGPFLSEELRNTKIIPALESALKDPNDDVQRAAKMALEAIRS